MKITELYREEGRQEILREVAGLISTPYFTSDGLCLFCGTEPNQPHLSDCLWIRAKKAETADKRPKAKKL